MKKFIRIILLILSVALILSVFASCGKDAQSSNKTPQANAGKNNNANDEKNNEENNEEGNAENGNSKEKGPVPVTGYEAEERYADKEHFLSFYCEDKLIVKMRVLDSDTYESLKPFFPTIPEKEGYTAYWEKPTTVYDKSNKNIRIDAVYEKQ